MAWSSSSPRLAMATSSADAVLHLPADDRPCSRSGPASTPATISSKRRWVDCALETCRRHGSLTANGSIFLPRRPRPAVRGRLSIRHPDGDERHQDRRARRSPPSGSTLTAVVRHWRPPPGGSLAAPRLWRTPAVAHQRGVRRSADAVGDCVAAVGRLAVRLHGVRPPGVPHDLARTQATNCAGLGVVAGRRRPAAASVAAGQPRVARPGRRCRRRSACVSCSSLGSLSGARRMAWWATAVSNRLRTKRALPKPRVARLGGDQARRRRASASSAACSWLCSPSRAKIATSSSSV